MMKGRSFLNHQKKGKTVTDRPGKVLASPIIPKQEMLSCGTAKNLWPPSEGRRSRRCWLTSLSSWPTSRLCSWAPGHRCHYVKVCSRICLEGKERPWEGEGALQADLTSGRLPTWAQRDAQASRGPLSSSSLVSDAELLTANELHVFVSWNRILTQCYMEMTDLESARGSLGPTLTF